MAKVQESVSRRVPVKALFEESVVAELDAPHGTSRRAASTHHLGSQSRMCRFPEPGWRMG